MRLVREWAVTTALLLGWTVLSFPLAVWHQLAFAVTASPLAGADRRALDAAISRYLLAGSAQGLGALTAPEQAHLHDVRTVLSFLVLALAVCCGLALCLRTPLSLRRAATQTLLLGLGLLAIFPVAFPMVHTLLFPAGNWQFPADSLLIETYPLAFFAAMWSIIVALAAATAWFLGRHERP